MSQRKYGLQLRVPPSQQKKQSIRPVVPKPGVFDEDDDDDVEKEISRQASKSKSLQDVEQQHKKALEEDPSIFDYDGVYDDMKEKIAQPRAQERQERKPRYIQALMEKAKQREKEQEIVYERKLAKERNQEEHLFAHKDKFVTSAYKRKLAEQAKWLEEERMRQLIEEKDDVTKKSDISDFYFSLSKNVAFGAREGGLLNKEKDKQRREQEQQPPATQEEEPIDVRRSVKGPSLGNSREGSSPRGEDEKRGHEEEKGDHISHRHGEEASSSSTIVDRKDTEDPVMKHPTTTTSEVEKDKSEESQQQPESSQPKPDHHKKTQDALASFRERALARKKAKIGM